MNKMFKFGLFLMLLLVLSSFGFGLTNEVIVSGGTGVLNPNNSFDGNILTFGTLDDPADYIGKTFDEINITEISILNLASVGGIAYSIDTYNGSAWTSRHTGTFNTSKGYLTKSINLNVKGIRISQTTGTGNTEIYEIYITERSLDEFYIPDLISRWFLNDTNANGLVNQSNGILDSFGTNNGTLYGKTFNHGTNNGATPQNHTGDMEKFGGYYEFDGVNDNIDMNSPSDLNFVNETFSISLMIKTNDPNNYIISKIQNTINQGYQLETSLGKLRLFVYETGLGGQYLDQTSLTRIDDGKWHNITINFNSSISRADFYVDGAYFGGETSSSLISNLTNSVDFRVGQRSDGSASNLFNGSIDEVKIWNRALTQTEIQQEMNANAVANPQGIVAYYDFNEQSGTTIYDNNHLTTGARQNTASITDPIFSYDKATSFDGVNDYVEVETIPNFNTSTNFTISLWMKTDSLNPQTPFGYASSSNDRISIYYVNNNLYGGTYNGTFNSKSGVISSYDDNWFMATLTKNNNNIKLYVNTNELTGTGITSTASTPNTFIGCRNDFVRCVNGSIGDVRIYDRALTEQEIDTLYYGFNAYTYLDFNDEIVANGSYKINIKNAGYEYEEYITEDNKQYHLNNQAYNFTISLDGTDLVTYEETLLAGANFNNFSDFGINRVYFNDATSSTALANKSITVRYPNLNTIARTTDTNGLIEFYSANSEDIQYGNYTLTYNNDEGYVTPTSFIYDASTIPFNITYNISRTNINIYIYDRVTGSVFTNNASIIFQGVGNFTTSIGNYNFDALSLASGTYIILVKSEGYFTEQKIITFDNQETMNLSYYLLENADNSSVTVTVQVIDTTQTKVDNAEVNMLEYDLDTLSYISVSQGYTNTEGEVIFLAQLNSKTYKFTASKNINGFLRTGDSGDGGIIFRDEIVAGSPITFEKQTVQIILTGFEEFVFNPLLYLRYNITENFNETTNVSNVRVDFATTDSSEVTVCIEFFSVVGTTKTSELQLCDTGNAGTITPTTPFLLNRSKSYKLDVYTIDGDGVKNQLDSFDYASSTSFQELLRGYAIVKPFILFLWVSIIALALFSSNLVLAGVLGIILSIVEVILFPNILTKTGSILKILVCLQIIYFGRKKEDFT